jgi:hypothetical protein
MKSYPITCAYEKSWVLHPVLKFGILIHVCKAGCWRFRAYIEYVTCMCAVVLEMILSVLSTVFIVTARCCRPMAELVMLSPVCMAKAGCEKSSAGIC